jgi:hypothetical protein
MGYQNKAPLPPILGENRNSKSKSPRIGGRGAKCLFLLTYLLKPMKLNIRLKVNLVFIEIPLKEADYQWINPLQSTE